ncbi:MAG: lactate utilization protein [Neomegalonema sp.]|nr:lactate utilization protein [Neomegalonema sp.]
MSAREQILARLRRNLGSSDPVPAAQRLADCPAPQVVPAQSQAQGAARVAQFVAAAQGVQASVALVPDLAALPEAIADYLRGRNLPLLLRMGEEHDFVREDWSAFEISHGPGRIIEPITLSRAFAGIAETGTLVLRSGPANPVTLTFLGDTHLVVLRESEIEAGMEGVWKRLRAAGAMSRTVNFVTGPSRTADIGQKLEIGAHGPIDLHILLVAG